jgi:hypothetical protein
MKVSSQKYRGDESFYAWNRIIGKFIFLGQQANRKVSLLSDKKDDQESFSSKKRGRLRKFLYHTEESFFTQAEGDQESFFSQAELVIRKVSSPRQKESRKVSSPSQKVSRKVSSRRQKVSRKVSSPRQKVSRKVSSPRQKVSRTVSSLKTEEDGDFFIPDTVKFIKYCDGPPPPLQDVLQPPAMPGRIRIQYRAVKFILPCIFGYHSPCWSPPHM